MGVAVEPRQYLVDQLLAKADVIRATHERVQLCQRPQTEVALLRESLGVSGINHILREHGHTIFQEREAAKIFDKVGNKSLERFFPGFTVDSSKEATLSTSQPGSGDKRTRDVARPAHLEALNAAKTSNLDMIRNATKAELLLEQPLLARLDTAAFLDALDESKRPTAGLHLRKAAQAADESWHTKTQQSNRHEPSSARH